jgi:prefoldin subunit 5
MSKFGTLPKDAPEQMQESLESIRRQCGAVHKEASDFIDYLKQARLEVDEFKETTMKEIKALAQRTQQYSLDDNKEILLEDD